MSKKKQKQKQKKQQVSKTETKYSDFKLITFYEANVNIKYN